MNPTTLILATVLGGTICPSSAIGQAPQAPSSQRATQNAAFDDPELLMAGGQMMGIKRHYPSPVLHDLDGDGVRELIIGDLHGYITRCERNADGWGEEVRIRAKDGKDLRFHNW